MRIGDCESNDTTGSSEPGKLVDALGACGLLGGERSCSKTPSGPLVSHGGLCPSRTGMIIPPDPSLTLMRHQEPCGVQIRVQ